MVPPTRATVVLNAGSGTALQGDGVERLRASFAAAGCEAAIERARGPALRAAFERALAERPDVLVAGGGDGTISTAASVMAGSGIPLGVLPLGTLNHFAKDLKIPLDAGEAARNAVLGRPVAVDVGEVNGRIFINNSSLGLYPSIVRRREQLRAELPVRWAKTWLLLWATITALRRAPFLDVDLCLDGKTRRLRTPFVFIGNNEYTMEGLSAGEREGLDDGHLSVHTTTRPGRLGLVALGMRALIGRLAQARDFHAENVQSLEVRSRHKRLLVAADGEVDVMETPLRYRIRPRELTVMVPPEPPEDRKE